MAWEHIDIHRQRLYEEVWKEPVIHVAKRYHISDVGLRKIAVKLGVPLPPAGYWAKVAHGKAVHRTPLGPKGEEVCVRHTYHVNEGGDEFERRLNEHKATMAPMPQSQPALPAMRTRLSDCEPLVQRMAVRLNAAYGDGRGWKRLHGAGVFEISVSEQMRERALLLMDRLVRVLLVAGITVEATAKQESQAHVLLDGQRLTLRLFEPSRQKERELTSQEKAELKRSPYAYIPNRRYYVSTGAFKLEAQRLESTWPMFSLQDTKTARLKDRLATVPAQLVETAARLRMQEEIRQDEARRAEERRRILERKADLKRQELTKLEAFEQQATRLERANRLRHLAMALRSAQEQQPDEKLQATLEWLQNAADWLDPTVRKRWPPVDDAHLTS